MLEVVPLSVRSNIKLADLNVFYQQLQQHLSKNNRLESNCNEPGLTALNVVPKVFPEPSDSFVHQDQKIFARCTMRKILTWFPSCDSIS